MGKYRFPRGTPFWGRVRRGTDDECWEWQGYRDPAGYGQLRADGVLVKAHRYAFMDIHGRLPAEAIACHHCDNPPCCNPAHLFIGTHADNVADKIRKGRGRFGVSRGERNGSARLSAATVRRIRLLYRIGHKQAALAEQFAVHQTHISLIVRHAKWQEAGMYEKEIVFDPETRDFAMYLDGELVGFARTYQDAEVTLDELVYELLNAAYFRQADDKPAA